MSKFTWLPCAVILAVLSAPAAPARAQDDGEDLRRKVEDLERRMEEKDALIERLLERVERLERGTAGAQDDEARPDDDRDSPADDDLEGALEDVEVPPLDGGDRPSTAGPDLWGREFGSTSVRLVDLSLSVLTAAGGSTERGDDLRTLQGGAHDPNRRGFTLQQAELALTGAVDPYFRGEAYVIFSIDPDGETITELEEAFLTTTSLPHGLEVQFGQMYTEFGLNNPSHPHSWDFLDQPVINTRLFGGEGTRAPGVRVRRTVPLPWWSEVVAGVQNADHETAASFLGAAPGGGHAHEDEGEDEAIGNRPVVDRSISGLDDFLYSARWVHGGDLSETLSGRVGASAVYGPNATGTDGDTFIWGGDVTVKWRPVANRRGWPFVVWTTEVMQRRYDADDFVSGGMVTVPGDHLDDWGLYTQLLWGFREGWAAGLRWDWATADGDSLEGLADDPFRNDRQRVSALLIRQLSEYSRARLQYNYDVSEHLGDAHSVWFGLEILWGRHPAHKY